MQHPFHSAFLVDQHTTFQNSCLGLPAFRGTSQPLSDQERNSGTQAFLSIANEGKIDGWDDAILSKIRKTASSFLDAFWACYPVIQNSNCSRKDTRPCPHLFQHALIQGRRWACQSHRV